MTVDMPTAPPDPDAPARTRRLGAARTRRLELTALAWVGLFALSTAVHVQTVLADHAAGGHALAPWKAVLWEGSSSVVWLCLLPLLYHLHRRWPVRAGWRSLAAHLAATLPFSLLHVYGMVLIRVVGYDAAGLAYPWPDWDMLVYEYRKDLFSYLALSGVLLALDHVLAGRGGAAQTPAPPPAEAPPAAAPPAAPAPPAEPARLQRFAVKRRGREVLISAADIAWIEAAGNYAVLHLPGGTEGAERFEIRSSLARLEAELDPAQFVRTHKSSIVNLAFVRELEPWFNGDYRVLLTDNTRLNLSRRYRERFEKAVPVKG